MAVVVDAKDENAVTSFYRHYGFLSLDAQPSRLFVPMHTVARSLG